MGIAASESDSSDDDKAEGEEGPKDPDAPVESDDGGMFEKE